MIFLKRINTKWTKYKTLWRDGLRVIAINITFAQINSSLPNNYNNIAVTHILIIL